MRGRATTVLIAGAMALTACTGAATPSTTMTSAATSGAVTTSAPAPDPPAATSTTVARATGAALPVFPDDAELIPVDDGARIGTLENGLSYYIRRNTRPGVRAQLRLAVKAGSVHEDEDQRGGAHYLEHMMFNGTERFPANELVNVLQRFGAEFGPDINAYTNFDETVYELQVPTDDDEIVATAFDVLAEWAGRATIDPAEVELERGVLLEEWRLRSQRFEGRYFDGVGPLLLAGTPYADRSPLADPDQLAATETGALRRFYEDWYRPDLMALVAVGDFDVDEIETMIRDRFEALTGPATPRSAPSVATAPFSEPKFFVLADPEYPGAFVELNYPLPGEELGTVGVHRRQLALDLAFEMLVTRLTEDALRGEAPYFGPSFAANPLVRPQRTPGLAALSEVADLSATAEALVTEVERALLHGFGAGELERAVEGLRRRVEQRYASRGTKQDVEFAGEYVEHFLGGTPIPDAGFRRDVDLRLLTEATVEQIDATFRATIGTTEPLVIVVGPESSAAELPTSAALAAVLESIATRSLQPRDDDRVEPDTLMALPEPAEVTSRNVIEPFGALVLELENGARVVLYRTDIGQDTIVFGAASPGGWSVLPEGEVAAVQLAADMVVRSGVGGLDQVELDRLLADKVAGVGPVIDETRDALFGQAASDDVETLFQLIHLYMTEPRLEPAAVDAVLNEVRPFAAAPETVPELALILELIDIRFAGDHRYRLVPRLADIDRFDPDRALRRYRERYANASDFVFVFSGDFSPARMEDLARRYLGTLPGTGVIETWADHQPSPPDGIVRQEVRAGQGELAAVALLFGVETPIGPQQRVEVRLLESIVTQRLTERIREQLSATYSPLVSVEAADEPDELIEVYIQVSADPGRLDEVSAAVLADLADLRADGPTADQLAIAKEQVLRSYELVSNEFWIETWLFYAERPGEDVEELFERFDRVEATGIGDIRDLVGEVAPGDRYVEVRLLPAA